MRFKIKENNKVWLLTALMVYFSNGLFPQGHISAFLRVMALLGLLVLYLPQRQNNDRVLNKAMCGVAIVTIALQIVTITIYGIQVQFDIFLMLAILIAVLFATAIPLDDFVEQYRKIIFWIALISTVLFLVGAVLPQLFLAIPSFLLQDTKWDNVYTILGTFVIRFKSQYTYYRNFGIFSEPGQFQIFLNIGLFFELFFASRLNKRNTIVLLLAVITCRSTNGYLVTLAMLMAYILNSYTMKEIGKRNDRMKFVILMFLGAAFVFIAFPDMIWGIFREIMEKLAGLTSDYSYSDLGTGLERRRAFDVALQMYFKNPITGLGYAGMDAYQATLSSEGFILSCTPINWFARFGTLYGLIANGCYVGFFAKKAKNIFCAIALMGAALMMVAAQAATSDIFIWVLIMYGVQQLSKQRKLFYRRESDLKSETNT